jgi:serine/threonine-protein kinase
MTSLGRYEIIEKIGSGSMGTVYRAKDSALDREVALKTIRTGAEVEPELRERFYREARACARLQHPHIITVYDLGEAEQIAYIAMELLDGRDLRKVIVQREPIPVVVKIEIMVQICDALAYAHSRGIVHRDVKPSNLFLVGEDRAKVLDFGIARLPSSHLTAAGKILGTPNYMAPEQILGKPTDARSDLFSAAVVFFELLAYAHPFKSQLIPRRIVESDPDSVFDYDPKLPPLLEGVFARALAKDPEQRYQRVDDLGADLRAIAEALRLNASPTFSRVQLPSARDIAPPQAAQASAADLSLLQPAPAGEDPYEWRTSEVLRLMPEFDKALELRQPAQARKILEQLEAIGAVDQRFGQTVDLCRKRLAAVPAVAAEPSPGTTDGGVRKYCPTCGTPNRRQAQFCIGCGASFAEQSMAGQKPLPPPQAVTATTVFRAPTREEIFGPPPPLPATAPPPVQPQPQSKVLLIVAGAVVLLLIVAGLLWTLLRQPKAEPAVAQALVHADKTDVYRQPGKDSIVSLSHGDRVQVLRLPSTKDDEWTQVQFVGPKKTYAPGYARTADLEGWDSSNADSALALLRTFAPAGSANDWEVDSQIKRLRDFIQRFPGTRAVKLAHIEIANLEMGVINRKRAAGDPVTSWTSRLDNIRAQLGAVGSGVEIDAAKEELQRNVTALAAEAASTPVVKPPDPTTPVNTAPRDNINQLLAQATSLWNENKYQEAEAVVERILRVQPGNASAIALQKKIKSALELERSTIR